MLGVRLDPELEVMVARVALQQGRSKSDLARDAIRRYVERYDQVFLAEVQRQCAALTAYGTTQEDLDWEALAAGWDDDAPAADAAE